MELPKPLTAAEAFRLDGRVAVITGSTRGIGLATARMMAEAGARVVISSRKPEACEKVRSEFAALGFDVRAIPCNVGREEDRQRLIEGAVDAFGRLDVVVSNAAANPLTVPLQDLPESVWDKVLDTDLKAPWQLGRLALPIMAEGGGGAYILVSSTGSLLAYQHGNAYSLAKAALNHLARQLAVQWGPRNIRVNSVAPGLTRTDMTHSTVSNEQLLQARRMQMPLRRIGEPDDVAALIHFLASDAGRHITGQTIVVDGGQTLVGSTG